MESHQENFSSKMENEIVNKNDEENKKYRFMAQCYIVGISGLTAVIAGLVTSHVAKKKGREYLKELGKEPKVMIESPHMLALRALAWGTFWAVSVCSLSVFGIWKYFGLKDLEDLRTRVRKYTRKNPPDPNERTEFENLSDFLNYLNEKSKTKSEPKKSI